MNLHEYQHEESGFFNKFKSCFVKTCLKCISNQPSLVLDLDNTLIHTTRISTKRESFSFFADKKRFYVHCRPGLKDFLKQMSECYEIFFFTASKREYGEKIIQEIAPFVSTQNCFFHDSCVQTAGYSVKDLRRIDRPLNRCILVDDIKGCGLFQPQNVVCVQPWNGESSDKVLPTELGPLLLSCAKEGDILSAIRELVLMRPFSHIDLSY